MSIGALLLTIALAASPAAAGKGGEITSVYACDAMVALDEGGMLCWFMAEDTSLQARLYRDGVFSVPPPGEYKARNSWALSGQYRVEEAGVLLTQEDSVYLVGEDAYLVFYLGARDSGVHKVYRCEVKGTCAVAPDGLYRTRSDLTVEVKDGYIVGDGLCTYDSNYYGQGRAEIVCEDRN